jgi:hypothetical protein
MALSLKNKVSIVSIFTAIILLSNCGQNKEEEKSESTSDTASCAIPSINPNGDSELSLLMRDMVKNSETLRIQVQNGKLEGTFPEAFFKIYTAKPTDSDTKKESFKVYADNYLSSLKKLYDSPKEELNENYNSLINACASCHSEHCPGPMRKINKLKLY